VGRGSFTINIPDDQLGFPRVEQRHNGLAKASPRPSLSPVRGRAFESRENAHSSHRPDGHLRRISIAPRTQSGPISNVREPAKPQISLLK
jgi:hypothetical protein